MIKQDKSFKTGHKITSREHMDLIAKYGRLGRWDMETTLNNETTLNELRSIESHIRTAIMAYASEMRDYDTNDLGGLNDE